MDMTPLQRCLIVDDSSVIRKVARVILDDLRFEVIEAGDCKEASDLCSEVMPNVILLDWHMPGQNPLEFVAELRTRRSEQRPFIIYMTSEHDIADITRAINAGADDFVLKPFTRQTLADKIEPIRAIVGAI